MFLTLVYGIATFWRSWKIRSLSSQVSKHIGKSSVVFYNLPNDIKDILLTPVSSELCTNQSQAIISDFLWYNDQQRGCSISPLQTCNLKPWITFPPAPNILPFEYFASDIELDENNIVHILIETDLMPSEMTGSKVMVENYGVLVAWKVDTNIAILLKSDLNNFVNLLSSTFLQSQFLINDQLPILRIEYVIVEGEAQPFDLLKNHMKKEFLNRTSNLTAAQWERHLNGLKSFGVLASQATEFEYNKNLTEGKTGLIKPDLISSKNIEDSLLDKHPMSPDSPKLFKAPTPKLSPLKIDQKILITNEKKSFEEKVKVKQESITKESINQPIKLLTLEHEIVRSEPTKGDILPEHETKIDVPVVKTTDDRDFSFVKLTENNKISENIIKIVDPPKMNVIEIVVDKAEEPLLVEKGVATSSCSVVAEKIEPKIENNDTKMEPLAAVVHNGTNLPESEKLKEIEARIVTSDSKKEEDAIMVDNEPILFKKCENIKKIKAEIKSNNSKKEKHAGTLENEQNLLEKHEKLEEESEANNCTVEPAAMVNDEPKLLEKSENVGVIKANIKTEDLKQNELAVEVASLPNLLEKHEKLEEIEANQPAAMVNNEVKLGISENVEVIKADIKTEVLKQNEPAVEAESESNLLEKQENLEAIEANDFKMKPAAMVNKDPKLLKKSENVEVIKANIKTEDLKQNEPAVEAESEPCLLEKREIEETKEKIEISDSKSGEPLLKANNESNLSEIKEIATKVLKNKEPMVNAKPKNDAPKVTDSPVIRPSRPTLRRTKKNSLMSCKPPNILVYSESVVTRDNVLVTLKKVLEYNSYTIYPLSINDVSSKIWMDNTILLVVCGTVEYKTAKILLDYFLYGGKMLCLCSDLLHIVLNTYRTAEVREHELVQFSYGRWKNVKMMHHIFCYQPSPVKKNFSVEGEETFAPVKNPKICTKRFVDVKDLQGLVHNIQVEVLGNEEIWNTPSLMLGKDPKSNGIAVFSQVHLEADPSLYEAEEQYYKVLKQNDATRIEILSDILGTHLGLTVNKSDSKDSEVKYKTAYFLGAHERKVKFLNDLQDQLDSSKVLKNGELAIQFCCKGEEPSEPSFNMLPVMVYHCPENFSTLDYFNYLNTTEIGRIGIFAPIMTSSMDVLTNMKLSHGLVVIPKQQTKGVGRSKNQWLSPEGCVMFSLQLHIPLNSLLGRHLPLIQHLIAVAVVSSILNVAGYEDLDIRLKWPNDIYANGSTKIGGLIVNSIVQADVAIVNIGLGINMSNSAPTLCINDLIKEHNMRNNKKLPDLSYEKFLALIFTEIEKLYVDIQTTESLDKFYELYYKYWLHSDTNVSIMTTTGDEKWVRITGIDEYGYLLVQESGKAPESVHPDGNTFDMLRGLISPKIY